MVYQIVGPQYKASLAADWVWFLIL